MILFVYYLLRVILVSGLLYAYYLIALKNKKFHQYNRFYLLITVLLSLIIPLLKLEFASNSGESVTRYLSVLTNADVYVKQVAVRKTFLSDYNLVALYAFLFITSIAFSLLAYQLSRIFLTIKANPKKVWNSICFVFVESQKSPFSFFRYIFWNDNIDINSDEGKCILQHELTHVQQKHSCDKLFVNLVLVGGWANPFFWIIRKELNMLHEFIADQEAVSDGDANAFAAMLLTAAYPQHPSILTNSFFHSPIKRRLLMFTTSKITHYSHLRRFMILPLLLLISVLFAFKVTGKNEEAAKPGINASTEFVRAENLRGAKEDLAKEETPRRNNDISVIDTIEKSARFMGGDEAWKRYLETNLNANVPANDHAPKGIYSVRVRFIVTEEGEIKDVSALQVPPNCPSCGKEAVRIIKISPKWDPGVVNGKKVLSQNIQFISFLVE